jgi:hypothetical protein
MPAEIVMCPNCYMSISSNQVCPFCYGKPKETDDDKKKDEEKKAK